MQRIKKGNNVVQRIYLTVAKLHTRRSRYLGIWVLELEKISYSVWENQCHRPLMTHTTNPTCTEAIATILQCSYKEKRNPLF